jgi:hypothetical protein
MSGSGQPRPDLHRPKRPRATAGRAAVAQVWGDLPTSTPKAKRHPGREPTAEDSATHGQGRSSWCGRPRTANRSSKIAASAGRERAGTASEEPEGKAEVLGGVGVDPRCRDEQGACASGSCRARCLGPARCATGSRQLVLVKSTFHVGLADQRQQAGDVLLVDIAEAGGRGLAAVEEDRSAGAPGATGASWRGRDQRTRRRTVPPGIPASSKLRRQTSLGRFRR